MLRKILLILLILLAALSAYVASRPDTYTVERSAVIEAPVEVTFEQVNDFRRWDAWSPWDELDPEQKKTYTGPDQGEGAVTAWSGNDQVGRGKMTITESVENEKVVIDLQFQEPFESESTTTFRFEPAGENQTRVSWSMSGETGLMMKAMSLFMNFDEMVGNDFERGLSMLDDAAREEAAERAEAERAREAEAAAPEEGGEAEGGAGPPESGLETE